MSKPEIPPRYAVVWVDHKEAKVLFLHREDAAFDERVVHARFTSDDKRHSNGRRHHIAAEDEFFEEVTTAMQDATDCLVLGPATARNELVAFIEKHHRNLLPAVRGVEKVDHPSNGELAEHGRRFFEKLSAPRQIFVRG